MGRMVRSVLNEKAVDIERQKLLGSADDTSSFNEELCSKKTRRHSLRSSTGSLPSFKDAIKLVLFCTVTVLGMTVLSETFSRTIWNPNSQSQYHQPGSTPTNMDTCPSSFHNTSLSMDFPDPTKFIFTQISQSIPNQPDPRHQFVKILGSIEVHNTDRSSGSYVHVDLDIRGSNPQLTNSEALKISKTDSELTITTPKRSSPDTIAAEVIQVPCLYISAVITINGGAKLEKVSIDSESLAVMFRPGLDYAESRVVETKAHFESTSTYSRETIINVNSASVTGSFPLYDLLSIHTESGSISADIVPKNASREIVKPAVLKLSSNSGAVKSTVPTSALPDRDYQTSISTSSGSIEAGILHGSRTSLRSINGRIVTGLYPYGHKDSKTNIEVHDTSGNIDITLHSSISHPTQPMKKLCGYYRGVSGSLSIFYPAQWQGTVEGNTLSGGVDLDWQGLRLVKDAKDGAVKRSIKAVRGEGEGKLEFHETSGSVRLRGESGGL